MRKALVVGIDYYENVTPLHGCVNDAYAVNSVLERHADGTLNFANPKLLTGTGPDSLVDRVALKTAVRELFTGDAEIALFYFSGHGYLEDTGGYLCASDAQSGDDGLSLNEVMTLANQSPATNKVIILDSCHSGAAANTAVGGQQADIRDGVTILSASTAEQYALASGGSGVFTNLLVDALNGAAANLVGDITPGSVYAHVDQSLGPWQQRPVFKTNVKSFVSLRRTAPPIALSELQQLTEIFPSADYQLPLDPSYEPDRSREQLENPDIPDPDPVKNATFEVLQRYVKVNLVRPVGAAHMYFAAMESKACELTVLGEHYWKLVKQSRI
ncbi:caspase family protein [Paenarthrobacter sp. YJN-5]|uniref:caspase family protein n=1 Tax=Paenarthrobacter sp. YJN-5 TaxID=2735316 RepID=UPI0018785879|nr:caspase family protein [Paenarthrobacter sp. YJN-5]QOT19785.1 caspase family protein [Paenarthrobacter sp. YJN-5]